MKQKTQSEVTVKFSPYGINGEYYVYDNELGQIPMGYGQGGTKEYIKSQCDELNKMPVTVNESKHTKGEWYWYDSKKDRWGGYSAGEWVQFELATKLSGKPLDTQSIGKISFTAKGGNNKDDYEVCKANAQRIVTAVNMHDELVGLLKFIRESYWDLMTEEIVNHIDTAIAKATNSK